MPRFKERKGDPVQAELDISMKRIGELIMQVAAGGQDGDLRPFGAAEVAAMLPPPLRHGFGLRPPAGSVRPGVLPVPRSTP